MIHASQVHGTASLRAQEYLAGWQRARAELDNFRRRTRSLAASELARSRHQLAEPLLALADNFHTAASALPAELAQHSWAQGVLHITRQLDGILARLGLTAIAATGVPFDPRYHEAISEELTSTQPPDTVVAVHQAGYRIGERVIRPAKVIVAR